MTQSDIAILLERTAEQLLGRERAVGQSGPGATFSAPFDRGLWAALEDAGLTAALEGDPEDGLGVPPGDAISLARIAGRHAAPVPLVETLLGNWLAGRAGVAAPAGPLTVAPVHRLEQLELSARDSRWRLSGTVRHVPFARDAAAIVVVASSGGCEHVAVVRPDLFTVEPAENLAGEARDTVVIAASLSVAEVGELAGARSDLHRMGALARSLQMTGAMERILDLTLEYAPQRVQFGQPITKFQSVQNNIAAIMSQMSASRMAVDYAVGTLGQGHEENAVAAAKARVGEACAIVSRQAHQVHGAIGFTQEYALHTLTRRLWAWRDEFGNEQEWNRRLGGALLASGSDLWTFITRDI